MQKILEVREKDVIEEKKDYSSTSMDGKEFRKTNEALDAKQKELKKERNGNKPNAERMLTDEEVHILYGQDLIGCSSSEALRGQPFYFFWGEGVGGGVILKKNILQVHMRKKKIPAQDHRPKKISRTYRGLEKKILVRRSLC